MALSYTYTHTDGRLMRVVAAPKEKVEQMLGPLTDEEFKAHVIKVSIPADATDVHEMSEGWRFPADTDATFRLAWRKSGMTFSVDMPKARDIWRDKIRAARAPVLAALDVEAMRATEAGKPVNHIVARKQALRDAPADPAIDAANTPDELKAVWPAILKS